MADRKKMLNDLSEIGKSSANGKCLTDSDARLWGLENRIAIIDDEITHSKLRTGKKEMEKQMELTGGEIPRRATVYKRVDGWSL